MKKTTTSKSLLGGLYVTTTYLIWQSRRRVLGHRAWCVRRHVFEDSTQPLNDDVVLDFGARHTKHIVVADALVPEGVSHHQWLHPLRHEIEGHMLSPQSGLPQGFDLLQQWG
jgi:hypothetical protein